MSLVFSRNRVLRLLTITTAMCWLVVVGILNFYGSTRSLDNDETYTVWITRPGWRHILENLPLEPQPPLYYGPVSLWIQLGGESEAWVRTSSGLVFLGGMASVWLLGRKVLTPRKTRWLLVGLATSNFFLWRAIEARMYGPLGFEAALATVAYLGLLSGRLSAKAAGPILFVVCLAGIFTHYFFFYLLGTLAFHYLFLSGRCRAAVLLGSFVAPGLIFAALWGPMFLTQLESNRFEGDRTNPIWSSNPRLWPRVVPQIVANYYGKRGFAVALPGLALLALIRRRGGRYRLVSRREFQDWIGLAARGQPFRALAAIWLALLIGSYLVGLKTGLYHEIALGVLTLPLFILLVAHLFARCGDARLRAAFGLTLLAATLFLDGRARYKLNRDPSSDRVWIQRMLAQSKPGDSVICCASNMITLFEYYMKCDAVGARMKMRVFPQDLIRHPGWYNERTALKDRAGLVHEAESLAADLTASARGAPDGKVWLVVMKREHQETNQIMTDALETSLTEVDRITTSGNSGPFEQMTAYVPRVPSTAASTPASAGDSSGIRGR